MMWWQWALVALGALALLWIIGNVFTGILQDKFIFRPTLLARDHTFGFKADFEEKWLTSPDGGMLNYLHFKPTGASKGVVFYCHGNAGDLSKWGHRYTDFLPHGWELIIWDYRGFGKSSGRRNEQRMVADAVQLAGLAHQAAGGKRFMIYGRSMGSALACAAAAIVPCEQLVLETPFSSMPDLFYTYYPFLPPLFRFKYVFDNNAALKAFQGKLTIFHGTRDLVIPHRCAAKLRQSLKLGDHFITLAGAAHGNVGTFAAYQEKLAEILL